MRLNNNKPLTKFSVLSKLDRRNWLETYNEFVHERDKEEAEVEGRQEQGASADRNPARAQAELLPVLLRAHRGDAAILAQCYND